MIHGPGMVYGPGMIYGPGIIYGPGMIYVSFLLLFEVGGQPYCNLLASTVSTLLLCLVTRSRLSFGCLLGLWLCGFLESLRYWLKVEVLV